MRTSAREREREFFSVGQFLSHARALTYLNCLNNWTVGRLLASTWILLFGKRRYILLGWAVEMGPFLVAPRCATDAHLSQGARLPRYNNKKITRVFFFSFFKIRTREIFSQSRINKSSLHICHICVCVFSFALESHVSCRASFVHRCKFSRWNSSWNVGNSWTLPDARLHSPPIHPSFCGVTWLVERILHPPCRSLSGHSTRLKAIESWPTIELDRSCPLDRIELVPKNNLRGVESFLQPNLLVFLRYCCYCCLFFRFQLKINRRRRKKKERKKDESKKQLYLFIIE